MSNYLVKSGVYYTVISFVKPLLSFLLLPFIVKNYTAGEYGEYVLMLAVVALFSAVSGLGVKNALSNFHFDVVSSKRKSRTFLWSLIVFATIVNAVILFIVVASSPYSFNLTEVSGRMIIAGVSCGLFEIFSNITTTYFRNVKQVFEANTNTLLYIFSSFILSIGCILLDLSLEWLFYARIFGAVLSVLHCTIKERLYHLKPRITFVLGSFRYSFGLLPWLVLTWALNYFDRFYIEKYLSLEQLGVFGVVFTLGSIVQIAYLGMASAIHPVFMNAFNSQNLAVSKRVQHFLVRSSGLVFVVLICFLPLGLKLIGGLYEKYYVEVVLCGVAMFLTSIQYAINLDVLARKSARFLGFYNALPGLVYLTSLLFVEVNTLTHLLLLLLLSKMVSILVSYSIESLALNVWLDKKVLIEGGFFVTVGVGIILLDSINISKPIISLGCVVLFSFFISYYVKVVKGGWLL